MSDLNAFPGMYGLTFFFTFKYYTLRKLEKLFFSSFIDVRIIMRRKTKKTKIA